MVAADASEDARRLFAHHGAQLVRNLVEMKIVDRHAHVFLTALPLPLLSSETVSDLAQGTPPEQKELLHGIHHRSKRTGLRMKHEDQTVDASSSHGHLLRAPSRPRRVPVIGVTGRSIETSLFGTPSRAHVFLTRTLGVTKV